MSLDAFGLTGTAPAVAPPVDLSGYLGPWPRLDRHGNVYWWECQEPGCGYRTDPEHRDGALRWTQQRSHAAEAHPDRDLATVGHPNSLAGCYVAAPPDYYLRH